MTNFYVLTFKDESGAGRTLKDLKKMQLHHPFDIADSSLAIHTNTGEIKVFQQQKSTLGKAFWGLLFGLIFFLPCENKSAIGTASGMLMAKLTEYGIEDSTIKKISKKLRPGTSGLFALTHNLEPAELEVLVSANGGEVIQTQLTPREEVKLERAFAW